MASARLRTSLPLARHQCVFSSPTRAAGRRSFRASSVRPGPQPPKVKAVGSRPTAARKTPPPQPPRSSPSPSGSGSGSGAGAGAGAGGAGADAGDRQSLSSLLAQRRLPFIGLALAAGVLGYYVSPLLVAALSPQSCCAPRPENLYEPGSHDHSQASSSTELVGPHPTGGIKPNAFDASLDWPEWLMGVTGLRRELAARARGHVLEVAVGTGRNLAYYDWDDVTDVPASQPEGEPRGDSDSDAEAEVEAEAERQRKRAERQSQKLRSLPREERQLLLQHQAPSPSSLSSPASPASPASSPEMTSYTAVDVSAEMLEAARRRLRTTLPGGRRALRKRLRASASYGTGPADAEGRVEIASALGGRVRLIQSDAEGVPLPPPPSLASSSSSSSPPEQEEKYYDTILQTFGLCSVPHPETVLANLASVLRPGTGRILLLEHGRGRWELVNRLLDAYAAPHHARFGCWWNRDMEEIVKRAAREVPGLEVVRLERPRFLQAGTLYWVELRVNPEAAAAAVAAAGAGAGGREGEKR